MVSRNTTPGTSEGSVVAAPSIYLGQAKTRPFHLLTPLKQAKTQLFQLLVPFGAKYSIAAPKTCFEENAFR